MRKTTTLVLVLTITLALCGSAMVTFARGSGNSPLNSQGAISIAKKPARLVNLNAAFQNYMRMKKSKSGEFTPHASTQNGFSATELRKAYRVDAIENQGEGITIAIIVAFGNPNAQADLNTYSQAFGLPKTQIKTVYPQGKPTRIDEGWAMEANLDLQMAHAMAPRANLVLEAAKTPTIGDLMEAVQDAYVNQGADIVSMSFGGEEFEEQTSTFVDGIFAAGTQMGVAFTASSGDFGNGAQYPAASPFVTAVGGTTLTTQADDSYDSEVAWSGSGGGLSALIERPAYQQSFQNREARGIPDVAMVADPESGVTVYNSFGMDGETGFFVLGGTSVGAPLFAGILALVDQQREGRLGLANSLIYSSARANYTTKFHDIRSGENGDCGAICQADPRYDYVTGLGSPVGNMLIPALIAMPD